MAIQAINNQAIANFGFANPVQSLGSLAITMFAMHIISNLPGAAAIEASAERQACEIICEPLPGGKDDAPERICVETCEQGAEIIKTTTKESIKDGKWKTVEVLGKIATPVAGYFDCASLCTPAGGITKTCGDAGLAAWELLYQKNVGAAAANIASAAAKAGCLAILATPAGYPGCMTCCAGTKFAGVN